FQWCAMDPLDEVRRKQALLAREAKARRLPLRLHEADGSWLEAILARGDRRVGEAISLAYALGARFDSWQDALRLDLWREAFARLGLDTAPFLGTLPMTARLPWDHIDVGLAEGFLAREYRRALANRLSPPCGKVAGTFVHPASVA